jgi:putative membrane protein insertion efficiency factor
MTEAKIWRRLEIWLRRAAVLPIRLYQWTLSPLLPRACRFAPSCSEYAAEAILTHGPLRGVRLAVHRLGRCHPWGGHGYDPVPPAAHRDTSGAPLARPRTDAISGTPLARPGIR